MLLLRRARIGCSTEKHKWRAEKSHSTTRRYKDARIWPQLTILSLWTRRRSSCRPTAWLRPRFLPGLPGLSAHKLVQYWSRTPADRPTFSPRRLLVSLPHHGEWWEPARAVRRGAAPSSGAPGASSASRSEGPGWLAERATHRKGDPSEERPIGRATDREGRPIGRSTHRQTGRATTADGRAKITPKKVLGSPGRLAPRFAPRRQKGTTRV